MKRTRNDPESILNSLAGALITTDIHGIITFLNSGARDLTGFNEGELLGKSVGDIFQIIDLPTTSGYGNIVEFVLNKGKFTWQIGGAKLSTRNNKVLPVAGSAAPVDDSEGNTTGVVLFINDPADSRKAEEQFHESERRFRSLYENATLGMYRTTPDGRILLANPALLKMLGYSSFSELAKRSLEREGYEPDYEREDFKKRVERYGEVLGYEAAWHRLDGNTVFIRESAKAIKDENDNTVYYEGTVEDITERKLAEEKLKISEKTLRLFVLYAPAAIAMFDRDMHYIAASHRYITDYRLHDENIIGHSHYEIFPEIPERWK
ncbi:MAG TPA: PAS domain S-box protein, partial [Ignavibacteriaceae bacterium]|nr:PAS domain S-box protein [Ignavibacteriaceae bacterium]